MLVGIAQIAPVVLDREATLDKVVHRIEEAGKGGLKLVAFGEALVPGYPVWLSRTGGARFDDDDQKELHARYLDQGVDIAAGHLDRVCEAARAGGVAVVLGAMERASDRGGHTLYCSCVYIGPDGTVGSSHRKLVPTYEERLSWGAGDGAGLVVHDLPPFRVGALNCWENWMPMARASLYAAGENVHVAIWPGSDHNTGDITRFIARESRSYVISASGLLREEDFPADVPSRERIVPTKGEMLQNGGSAAAGPDGEWILEPVVDEECLLTVELDHQKVLRERQNFDASGHYSRPDVLRLHVDRRRQSTVEWSDGPDA